jgi:hypothetical protein
MALAHLRQRPVAADADGNIVGNTPEAYNCRQFYDTALREALRAFDWSFARQYLLAQAIPGAAVPNWTYAYEIPDGVEIVRRVALNDRNEAPVRFVQMLTSEGGVTRQAIFTNEPAAWLIVTMYLPTPEGYPSDFVEFFTLMLAAYLAMPITGKAELMTGMRKLAQEAGKRAAATVSASETDDMGSDPDRDALPTNTVPLDIANLALGLLAQPPIETFGDRTPRANAVRQYYALALRATLRSVDWPFARVYAAPAPAPAGVAMIPGYAYAYTYPANCTAIRGFAKAYPTQYDARFKLANGLVFTRRPAGTLIYTRWDIDPAQYDAEFTVLLAHELAAMIAVRVTGKMEPVAGIRSAAKMLRDKSRDDAANEDGPGELDERVPDWLAVRGIPSLVRQDREELMRSWGWRFRPAPWGELPGGPQVNPTPPMITGPGPGSAILPAYIPGLTAPVEPPAPLLASSNFWVESVGGRIERDGRLVVDDPAQSYVEPQYDVQEDN